LRDGGFGSTVLIHHVHSCGGRLIVLTLVGFISRTAVAIALRNDLGADSHRDIRGLRRRHGLPFGKLNFAKWGFGK
jgi:hypothetical protein